MKEKKIIILLIVIIIILIGMCLNKNVLFVKEKQIIKEMSATEYESTITALGKSQEEYAANVDAYKKKVTEAITNQGVETAMDAKADVVAENIGKILGTRTEATATAEDILDGKTAWVNGNKITGTNKGYDAGYEDGKSDPNLTVVKKYSKGNGTASWTYTAESAGKYLVVYSGGNGGSTKSNTKLTGISGYTSITVLVDNYQGIDTSLTYPWSSWSYVAVVDMAVDATLTVTAGGNAKTLSIIKL